MTSDSLLGHLAWRFPGATEDIATDALQYILSKQESARTALADLLRAGGADPKPMDSFNTQRVYQRSKKPDLVAFNKEGKEVLLVESKFWAWLTPNQPSGYLTLMMNQLSDAKNLLFVAPEASQGWLWDELCRRAKEDKFKLTDARARDGVRSTAVGSGGHRLMLTSWDTLLGRLEHNGVDKDGDLRQLVGLCAQMDDDAPRPSGDAEELGEVSHYEDLVKSAVQRARERGYIDTKGLGSARWQGSYGRYIKFVNAEGGQLGVARIGIDFDRDESPFFLWFTDNYKYFSPDRMQEIRGQLRGELDEGYNLTIKIPLEGAGAVVLESVVSKLKEIRDRIAVPERGA